MESSYYSSKCYVPTKLNFDYLNWFFIDSPEETKTNLEDRSIKEMITSTCIIWYNRNEATVLERFLTISVSQFASTFIFNKCLALPWHLSSNSKLLFYDSVPAQ